jgi:hypothetical protein
VLTALAGNHTAELSAADMDELVEASRQIAAMRTPLSQHPKLTGQLAKRLYLWVGLALRQGLAERFRLDVTVLDEALAASVPRPSTASRPRPSRAPAARASARRWSSG